MTRADEYRRQYKAWSTADRKRFWITIHTIPLEEWQEIRAALQSLMTPASEKWAALWKPDAAKRAGQRAAGVRLHAGSLLLGGGNCNG